MKKTAFVVLTILSFNAQAVDEGVTINGKNIAVSNVVTNGDERVINKSDLANGVFVSVNKFMAGDVRPNTTKILRERFAAAGIKLSDTVEGSSMSLQFDALGTIDIGDAETAAAYTSMPNSQQVAVNGGVVIAGVANLGKAGVIGALVGLAFKPDAKSSLMANINIQPHMEGKKVRSSVKDGNFVDGVRVTYKLEKDKEAGDDVVLMMLADQWIKKYVQDDTKPIAALDASVTKANSNK